MMKHLQAWGSGALLCCSAVAFTVLGYDWALPLAGGGLLSSSGCHALIGYLTISSAGAGNESNHSSRTFCAAAALIWTVAQAAFALFLISALHIHVDASSATWMLAVSIIGQVLLVALTARSIFEAPGSSVDEPVSTMNAGTVAGPSRG